MKRRYAEEGCVLTLGGLTDMQYAYHKQVCEYVFNCQKSAEAIVSSISRMNVKG